MGEPSDFPFEKLLGRRRKAKYRLRGFRIVRTSIKTPGLTGDDLATLAYQRLDAMVSLYAGTNGTQKGVEYATLVPFSGQKDEKKWEISRYSDPNQLNINFEREIEEVERRLRCAFLRNGGNENREGVILIGVSTKFRYIAEQSVKELDSLAVSAEKIVLDRVVQTRKKMDPRYLIGRGKLREIVLHAKHLGADTLAFDTELTPAQASAISEESDLDVIDRSQLIIQIFARHAKTNEGKIQAKLAELQYNLPRLKGRGVGFSQLGGGIGTRGPGEKKLEQERRNTRKQIEYLERQIDDLCRRREHTRKNRKNSKIPTLSFIGYTNVGKSTLFNRLTRSATDTENKLFSTLNPTTRKVMLPGGTHVLMTDTVGFISKIPKELVNAFRATLEEIGEADMVIHVVDASDSEIQSKIESVMKIMESMEYENIPSVMVFNKLDQTDQDTQLSLREAYPQVPFVSAKNSINMRELLLYIERSVEEKRISGNLMSLQTSLRKTAQRAI